MSVDDPIGRTSAAAREASTASPSGLPKSPEVEDSTTSIHDFIHDAVHHDSNAGEALPSADGTPSDGTPREEGPFSALMLPMLRIAMTRLRARLQGSASKLGFSSLADLPVESQVFGRMVDALARRLFAIASPTLVLELNVARLGGHLEGEDAASRFRDYSVRYLAEPAHRRAIFEEYPVLGRLLATAVGFWVDSMAELIERFLEDRRLIAQQLFADTDLAVELAALVDVELALSDPHRGGRAVAVLELEGGRKLVYKPKSLAVDVRFQELLGWLAQRGLEHPHRQLGIVDRGVYGWSEYVVPRPCQDLAGVERFYWRQGSLLALLYALHGCDFHHENLIAAGETPVLIDLESLFHHQPGRPGTDAAALASRQLLESVYGIGLLPLVTRRREGIPTVDLGGLAGRGGVAGFAAPVLVDRGLDTMRFVRREVALPDRQNRPTLRGEELDPLAHLEVFIEGFSATYALLAEHREELQARLGVFAEVPVRYIARPTMRYLAFLEQTRHPDFLRREEDQERLLGRLGAESERRPDLAALLDAERADLTVGDIPYFLTEPASTHLWDSRGECVPDQLLPPGLERVESRLRALSERDRRAQVTFIHQALLPLDGGGPSVAKAVEVALPSTGEPPGSALYLEAALVLGERLLEQAVLGEDDVTWIGASVSGDQSQWHWQWRLAPLGPFLYDGVSGIALFLAHLAAVTGDTRFEKLADRATLALGRIVERPGSPSLGAFAGHAGVLYALYRLGRVRQADLLWTPVMDALTTRLIDAAPGDQGLDLMIGAAGGAVVALGLHEHLDEPKLLELARACGERLVASAESHEDGSASWTSGAASAALTGFSHGAAGISWALRRLAAAFEDPRYQDLAERGLLYERSLFDPARRRWRDSRSPDLEDAPFAWCHGGPGIALSRHLSRPLVDEAHWQTFCDDIRLALEGMPRLGFGGNHSLCHGDLGNAEMLLILSEALGEESWRREALRQTTRVATEVRSGLWRCGLPRHAETPGLMLGLAGIGYGLLRLAAPGKVPSILSLEL